MPRASWLDRMWERLGRFPVRSSSCIRWRLCTSLAPTVGATTPPGRAPRSTLGKTMRFLAVLRFMHRQMELSSSLLGPDTRACVSRSTMAPQSRPDTATIPSSLPTLEILSNRGKSSRSVELREIPRDATCILRSLSMDAGTTRETSSRACLVSLIP